MKKALIFIWFLCTGLALNSQHRNFSPDDSFTRQYFKRHYNYSHEVRLFNRSWNHLMSTYLLTTTFSNRLSSIASFDFPTNDPEVLLSDYYNKINQLNVSFVQQQEVNNAMIDQGIRGLGELAAGYARDNNITTNNALADFFIKEIAIGTVQERAKQKNAEKLELQRVELQATLESNLSTEMSTIRDQMLSENIQMRDKYLEAMVYEGDLSKEKYYTRCYEYFNCFSDQIQSEYAYNSSSWYKPRCKTPGLEYSTTINAGDYIDIAFRKLDLYRKYNNEIFVDGINVFLEAGLAENKQNPKAYFLKEQLTNDIIDKMFYAYLALTLDQENTEYKKELNAITGTFNDDFFLAIRNEDLAFLSRSIEKGFHLGREQNGRSAIETAIDLDKAGILEMFLNSTPEEQKSLAENGNSLMFHACAVDALEVIKKLISLGANPEFKDKNYSGLTALNIAEKNNSQKALFYLASNYNIKPALLYAKNSGADELERFSSAIYNAVPEKLGDITSVNRAFRKNISENSNRLIEENRISESDNSVKKNKPTLNNTENSNPGTKNEASNLKKDQKSDFLEHETVNGVKNDTSRDSSSNISIDTRWMANYSDPVELAKEVIKRSDIFWNPTKYNTNLTYYSVGEIAPMYGGGYILLESPKLAFEMVTGGFYSFTKSVTKDWILDIIERSVKTPEVICKEISETTMEQGISDYKTAYEIAARYKKTNILSREDALSFLDHRWGVNRMPIGRVLYNETISQKYSVSNEVKEKDVVELTDSFETSYKKTHSMTQTVSFTDAAFFIKDIGEIMEQKKLGLMNYSPYLNFEKKIENLNQNRIDEAKKFGIIP